MQWASYFHVVRKMDKVVDLGAVANGRGSQGATIDGGICANFDIVPYKHITDLKHLAMMPLVESVAIAVRTNDGARMDADAVTYFRPGIDDHVGVKTRVIAYLAVMTNMVAAQKRGPRADAHVVTYDDIRPMCAVESICAVSAITALGWMPENIHLAGKNRQ
jgi:hypothetical protein